MRSFAMNAARLACALALGGAAIARGEDVAPTTGSFELSLGAGYGQGLGPVGSGVPRL